MQPNLKARNRFEARQRTALDGRVWWCIFDKQTQRWSTYICHGKYKTMRYALYAIDHTPDMCITS